MRPIALLIFLLLNSTIAYCQLLNRLLEDKQRRDSARIEVFLLNDSVTHWILKDKSQIWKINAKFSHWKAEAKPDIWNINPYTEALTIKSLKLQIWKIGDSLKVWELEKGNQSLSESQSADFWAVNDSVKIWYINDSLRLMQQGYRKTIWYEKEIKPVVAEKFHPKSKMWRINDSTTLWRINDSLQLQTQKEQAEVWQLQKDIPSWSVDEESKAWTINDTTEIWRIDDDIQLWTKPKKQSEWQKKLFIKIANVNDSTISWQISKNIKVWVIEDSTQIWQSNPKKPVWAIPSQAFDRLWLMELPPPPKDTTTIQDSLPEKEPIKYAERTQVNKNSNLWRIDDKTRVWQYGQDFQLWQYDNAAKVWRVNDSTEIWTLNDTNKVSVFGDHVESWYYIDSLKQWMRHNNIIEQNKYDPEIGTVWQVNKHNVVWIHQDTISAWKINPYVKKIEKKRRERQKFMKINDSTELWQVEDTTKLWLEEEEEPQVWILDPTIKEWELNLGTRYWQINDYTRLFLVHDSVKFWTKPPGNNSKNWQINHDFTPQIINDTLSIWPINDTVKVFHVLDSISIWKKDKNNKVYTLDDSTKIWTYTPRPKARQKKKPTYWTFNGTGSVNFSQSYFENWAKGGENSLSTLTVLKLSAKYARKRVQWDNSWESKYGILKTEESDFRKNEDNFQLSSKIGYRAYKPLFYSFSIDWKSQFFRGFDYKTDSSKISNFMSPGEFSYRIGIDYKPSPKHSILLAPLTIKSTYIFDKSIDETKHALDSGKYVMHEPGASLNMKSTIDLTKDIQLENKLDLFTNYHDKLEVFDVDWQVSIDLKVNKYINTNISTHLIYDQEVLIKDEEGNNPKPRTQFKELLSVGFSYKL